VAVLHRVYSNETRELKNELSTNDDDWWRGWLTALTADAGPSDPSLTSHIIRSWNLPADRQYRTTATATRTAGQGQHVQSVPLAIPGVYIRGSVLIDIDDPLLGLTGGYCSCISSPRLDKRARLVASVGPGARALMV